MCGGVKINVPDFSSGTFIFTEAIAKRFAGFRSGVVSVTLGDKTKLFTGLTVDEILRTHYISSAFLQVTSVISVCFKFPFGLKLKNIARHEHFIFLSMLKYRKLKTLKAFVTRRFSVVPGTVTIAIGRTRTAAMAIPI